MSCWQKQTQLLILHNCFGSSSSPSLVYFPHPRIPLPVTKIQLYPPSFKVILTHPSNSDPSSSLFCSCILLTLRPGRRVVPGQRPAVGEGEPDGEDGRVGAVSYTRGGRVRCSSDGHGMGTWCVAATVLRRRWGFSIGHGRTAWFLNKNNEMGVKTMPWPKPLFWATGKVNKMTIKETKTRQNVCKMTIKRHTKTSETMRLCMPSILFLQLLLTRRPSCNI